MKKIKILYSLNFIFALLVTATAAMAGPVDIQATASGERKLTRQQGSTTMDMARHMLENGRCLEKGADLSAAIATYRQVAAKFPHSVEAHCTLGKALIKAGRPQSSLLSFTIAIRLAPNNQTALYERSQLCMRINLYGQAAKDLNRLIELRPGVADYHYQRARALLALDRIRDAFKDFLKAHEIDRKYPKPTLHEEDGGAIPTKVAQSLAPTGVPASA